MVVSKRVLNLLNVEIAYHFENSDNSDREIAYPVSGGFGAIQQNLREALSGYIHHVNAYDLPLKTIDAIKHMNQRSRYENFVYGSGRVL